MTAVPLRAGWYVQLVGEKWDLDDWVHSLNDPFDPVAIEEADGTVLLRSMEFDGASDGAEVREKAIGLIDRINGAMAVMHAAKPARLGAIIRISAEGTRSAQVFASLTMAGLGRLKVRATAVVLDPEGNPKPLPPPQPSAAQIWNEMAAADDDIADLLEQLGKADSWYEIYKTIELAEILAGGERELRALLGPSGNVCKNMRRTANFYRHARAPRPPILTTIQEAPPLLHFIVRTVLDFRQQNASRASA